MSKFTLFAGLAGLAFVGAVSAHGSIVLQSWDFASAAPNLNPTQVAGSVAGGPVFAAPGSGQLTTGTTLRASPTTSSNSHIEVASITLPAGMDTFRADYVIGGWNFTNGVTGSGTTVVRRLSIGFAGSFSGGTAVNDFLFTAGGSIRINTSGQILFTAESGGTGSTSQTNVVVPGFGAVRTTPIYVRVDANPTSLAYSVIFSELANFADPVYTFTGVMGTNRVGSNGQLNRLRIGPLDGGGNWAGDFINVDSLTYSAVPEPSTYAAIFGGLALVGAFVYRRRKNQA